MKLKFILMGLLFFTLAINSTMSYAATRVYITGSSNTSNDQILKSALEAEGFIVEVGFEYWEEELETVDFSSFDVIYLQDNYNWGYDFYSNTAQQNIVSFVENGGGLVTAEWVSWESAPSRDRWKLILPLLPVDYVSWDTPTSVEFTEAEPSQRLNEGVSSPFTFIPTDADGSFTEFIARSGATVFYTANTSIYGTTDGMVGWSYGNNGGRVFSFCVTNGASELVPNGESGDYTLSTLGRLWANSLGWVAREDEPFIVPVSPLATLLALGLMGFVAFFRSRKKVMG